MNKFVYVDASASWLKPKELIAVQSDFLQNMYANAGRGVCLRAGNVDKLIQDSRKVVADFIGAKPQNIVWTAGTTDSLNRIVNIIKNTINNKNIVVAVSDLDHHSARLPFEKYFENVVVMPLDEKLNIDVNGVPYADVVVITAMSNVLGQGQDVKSIVRAAKNKNPNVITVVDAAQSVVHSKINVVDMDCDFLCFSGHKIGSDTGVGVMYIKNINAWNVDKFGGGMVTRITDSDIVLNHAPEKFEAGTLPITQIIGIPTAIQYHNNWDGGKDLINFMHNELSKVKNIRLLTTPDACMVSFVPVHLYMLDFGALVGARGVCLRVGNMCASWIHKKLNVDGSARISVGPWNTIEDAEYVVNVIKDVVA